MKSKTKTTLYACIIGLVVSVYAVLVAALSFQMMVCL